MAIPLKKIRKQVEFTPISTVLVTVLSKFWDQLNTFEGFYFNFLSFWGCCVVVGIYDGLLKCAGKTRHCHKHLGKWRIHGGSISILHPCTVSRSKVPKKFWSRWVRPGQQAFATAAVSPSLHRAFRDTMGRCFQEGKYVVDIDKDIKIEATKLHTSLHTAKKRALCT